MLASMALAAAAQVSRMGGIREARLASSCNSVDEGASVTLAIGDARIRKGGVARVTGVRQSIYVEAGGVAEVQGTAATVFVAKGGRATVGGVRNQVVAEAGGNVVLVGAATMTMVEAIDLQIHQGSADCR